VVSALDSVSVGMMRHGVVSHGRAGSVERMLMGVRRAVVAVVMAAVAVATTACTGSDDTVERAGTGTGAASGSAQAVPEDVVQEDVGRVPVTADAGYTDAVTTFGGAEQVAAAATADARIARIALADCRRWTEGTVDPRLRALLTPELLTRVVAEPARPAGSVSSLLSDLPERDGNGYRLAAAATGGCEPGGPLRYIPGPVTVAVDRSAGEPRLLLTGGFVVDVRIGDTLVGAGRDWVFTSRRSAGGWLLTDVESNARVSWVPPSAG
jgi:hypothetical protein